MYQVAYGYGRTGTHGTFDLRFARAAPGGGGSSDGVGRQQPAAADQGRATLLAEIRLRRANGVLLELL